MPDALHQGSADDITGSGLVDLTTVKLRDLLTLTGDEETVLAAALNRVVAEAHSEGEIVAGHSTALLAWDGPEAR